MTAARARVKICGLTRAEDAVAAVDAGADFLGFVLSRSVRRVRVTEATRIIEAVRATGRPVECVGVFVDEPLTVVEAAREALGLDRVQLHGSESPEACAALGEQRVIKAFRPAPGERPEVERFGAWAILLDGRHPRKAGGAGVLADWDVAAELAANRRLFLAGGLTVENVEEAIRRVRPFAVDVSSGVESSPGVKDASLVRGFIAAVRAAQEHS
jgi:phosphoribosylanthranilate isomerase